MSSQLYRFSSPYTPSLSRIGPHNIDILNILIGSLLGDGSLEKDGNGVRFAFYQAKKNGEYLLWLHQRISSLGYCKSSIPQISSRKNHDGSLRYIYRFRTYTFSSFNWIYDAFYLQESSFKRKIIPSFFQYYMNPDVLAIWIMDDGCYVKKRGLKFSTNCFTLTEIKFLGSLLSQRFSVSYSIHKTGVVNQYNLYLPKKSLEIIKPIVKPYMHPSMYYKLGL